MENSIASLAPLGDEEIKPYKIHVSSKYLDLTKKKLELTRLPHEFESEAWESTPKSEVEPLIDFWLEQYQWRKKEEVFNKKWPQFRTAVAVEGEKVPLRVHFLHIKSPHAHAIPLLLLPSFPLTNLSLTQLFEPLTSPGMPTAQPFHLVVPSFPGLGFSDPFTHSENVVQHTAHIFGVLMQRLGYEFFVTSMTGSGRESPAQIDYRVARAVGEGEACLGVNFISPVLARPNGWVWGKYKVARFFHANVWGYSDDDFRCLRESEKRISAQVKSKTRRISATGLREPNTLAYALCDSPVGLLSLVCSALKAKSPNHEMGKEEVVDVIQLLWLPGPEAAMRFWSSALASSEQSRVRKTKVRAAITVFEEDDEGYVCPAWGAEEFDVLSSQRVPGKAGLLAWERGKVIVDGIRNLVRELVKVDERIKAKAVEEAVVTPTIATPPEPETILEVDEEESVVDGQSRLDEESSILDHDETFDPGSPDTVVVGRRS